MYMAGVRTRILHRNSVVSDTIRHNTLPIPKYLCIIEGRIFVSIDVSFFKDVPFYSTASEEVIHERSEENSRPLVDLVTPPVYSGSTNETNIKLLGAEDKRVIDKFKKPNQIYSRRRKKWYQCSHLYHHHLMFRI